MKQYPKIQNNIIRNVIIHAFGKLDGSNIRAEWSKKKGFYKFGSRKRLLGSDQSAINKAESLILNKYGEDIDKIFRDNKWDGSICFFEFYGPNSFAGSHIEEEHDVLLFDVNIHKKGMMGPKDFVKYFGHLDIAPLLYHGYADEEFISSVKNGTLQNMPFEGVVCKAGHKKGPIMFKIKSDAWKEKLWNYCGENKYKFEELL